MPDPDSYHAWLTQRRSVEPPTHLADAVMARLAADRNRAATARPAATSGGHAHGALEWISQHPWLQAACLVGGAAVGMLRLVAMVQFLLSY